MILSVLITEIKLLIFYFIFKWKKKFNTLNHMQKIGIICEKIPHTYTEKVSEI